MSFIHLHNHTENSLLNGAIRVKELVGQAKAFGMPAVAMTDYGNMFGAIEFYEYAKKNNIKPILGTVLYLPSHDDHTNKQHRRGIDSLFQLLVLIQNEVGYHQLSQLMTKSYLDGFYYKPRVDTKLLKEHNQGLIALSAGWDGAIFQYLYEGRENDAIATIKTYQEIFGERFYLELQENGVDGQHEINLKLIELGEKLGVPLVATNNCHYLHQDDAEAFETLRCIQVGATLHAARDQLKYATSEYYFKSSEQMQELFALCPQALDMTQTIADQINFDFELDKYHFPKFTPPDHLSLDDYLDQEARQGFEQRWVIISQQKNIGPDTEKNALAREPYLARLSKELQVIKQMGFSGYFLIVADFIRYAKSQNIPVGPGRGSAAGSLVAYCLNITDLDPLPYDLLFERFLNPERISMPDVDIDFCMNQRDKVLQYVGQKYGNVSQIITFGKMKAKAVIRDVGRVMEMNYNEVDKIAKLVPNALNITLTEAIEQEPRLREMMKASAQVTRLMEIAKKLEGLNRHASTHAAGVVISDRPLTDFLPLYKGSNGDVVTQFDMKAVERIGLIKFDFLGLKTLTVLQDTLSIIQRTQQKSIDLLQIDLTDPAVYHLLAMGDTCAIFQLESEGMKDLLVRMKPSTFEDLIAILALYRPGPLGSGMVDDFINRKHGKTRIIYDLPELKPILEDTYGVIVYQEQVMQISSTLAGYSLGEADLLRRAMGKKKVDEMAAQKLHFLKGAETRQVPRVAAEKVFDLMAKFAEYGFNKSHSAAYALVTFQTAFLKAHFPTEYLAAVLTTEMHNTDRILYYIEDCGVHDIKILPPDINEGFYGFSVIDEKTLRYGLGAIKNVGMGAIQAIVEERRQGGPYVSLFDACARIDLHRVNRRVFESLIKSGGFDSFDSNRAGLLANLEPALLYATRRQKENGSGQTSLFGLLEAETQLPVGIHQTSVEAWTQSEKLAFEKEAMGFYFSGHPLKSYDSQLRQVATANVRQLPNLPQHHPVTLGCIIMSHRVVTTKKGSTMAFVMMEDLTGRAELILFPEAFKKYAELILSDKPLVIKGTVERSEDGAKIIGEELHVLSEFLTKKGTSVHVKIPFMELNASRLQQFKQLLGRYPGTSRGYLHLIKQGESETVMELAEGLNLAESDALMSRINILFGAEVVEYE